MANRVTMNICGTESTLVAEESLPYMEKIGGLVDSKMTGLMGEAHVGFADAAVLTALNLADELTKAQEAADNLRRQMRSYLEENNQARSEIAELKRQLSRVQQGNKR